MNPSTIVPGATHRGQLIWDMPKPIGHVEHKTRRKGKKSMNEPKVVHDTVSVPVYRAVSASYYRYVRSQWKRQQRKIAEAVNA